MCLPFTANAGLFSFVTDLFSGNKPEETIEAPKNSQNMTLLKSVASLDPSAARGGGDIVVVGGSALLPETGPSGTIADIEENHGSTISVYVVRPGDTLSAISKMFGVTASTIIGANDIKGGVIQPGQTLIIFPISGLQHIVKSGDTVASIAKKYKADTDEILQYNNLDENVALKVGDTVFIPDAELPAVAVVGSPRTSGLRGANGPNYVGYYMKPIVGAVKTQGLHGYNGIDLGAPVGTPIYASASGDVIISKNSGWNGGYGEYIVISHANGTQTLYGHLSGTVVGVGYHVAQGQLIGFSGNTGKSTGPHLHFEVRGAKNPF
jgi:murein DD-endopeptidase MepM/ murein hydrolase activator NlpD